MTSVAENGEGLITEPVDARKILSTLPLALTIHTAILPHPFMQSLFAFLLLKSK